MNPAAPANGTEAIPPIRNAVPEGKAMQKSCILANLCPSSFPSFVPSDVSSGRTATVGTRACLRFLSRAKNELRKEPLVLLLVLSSNREHALVCGTCLASMLVLEPLFEWNHRSETIVPVSIQMHPDRSPDAQGKRRSRHTSISQMHP